MAYKYVETYNYHTHVVVDPTVLILHQAAKDGDIAKIKKCVKESNIEVDARDEFLYTPLMYSAMNGNIEIAQFLIECGSSLTSTNTDGFTALSFSANRGQLDMFRFLLQHVKKRNLQFDAKDLLRHACVGGNTEIARECIALGAKVNEVMGIAEDTPLCKAASWGHTALVKELVANGAKVDILDYRPSNSDTALMNAARSGHTETVKELIALGANVNAKNMHATALIKAAYNGHLEIVQELVKAGADVNAKEYDRTAKSWAKEKGHTEVVEELAKYSKGCSVQ